MTIYHTKSFKVPGRAAIVKDIDHGIKLDMVENLIVEHPRFIKSKQVLSRFHITSQKLMRTGKGSIGGVIGDFRSGKSVLVQNYIENFPRIQEEGGWRYPVVCVNARKDFDSKEAARQIMRQTGRPPRSNGSVSDLNSIAIERLGMLSTNLLVFDDAHLLLTKPATAASLVSLVCEAVNTRTCNVLLIGPTVVRDFVRDRDELHGRGNFPHAVMKGYPTASTRGEETYRLFVEAVDNRLPFPNASLLWEEPFFNDLKKFTRGSVAKTMNLIRAAAYLALDEDADCIEYHHFHTALMDQTGRSTGEDLEEAA